jgi:hypothetical protein
MIPASPGGAKGQQHARENRVRGDQRADGSVVGDHAGGQKNVDGDEGGNADPQDGGDGQQDRAPGGPQIRHVELAFGLQHDRFAKNVEFQIGVPGKSHFFLLVRKPR